MVMQALSASASNVVTFEGFQDFIVGHTSAQVTLAEYQIIYKALLGGLTQSEQPKLIIFGGGPGTGKTTYRMHHFGSFENTHVHDMDEVLVRLDGYQKDLQTLGAKKAFVNWWRTARSIADQLVQYAFEHKLNVAYDRTCGAQGSFDDLQHAVQKRGYKATMYAFSIPEEEAIRRVQERAKVAGRTVTQELIREYARRFSGLFEAYLGFIDYVYLFYNNEEIFVKTDDQIEIIQPDIYQRFLDSGSEYR